jgi:3-hydroxybutyryl-CoA dehydrogenase
MNILVIGAEENFNECCSKFGSSHVYSWINGTEDLKEKIKTDIIFDFDLHNNISRFEVYANHSVSVFADTSATSLKQLVSSTKVQKIQSKLFGFCGLPTLLDCHLLEVSLLQKEDEDLLTQICNSLNTNFRIVNDHAGLVTPRIICMIINEAYYAFEEGVASIEDIDNAMKLGTNYPLGPFEWCKKIGAKKVVDLLHAVYKESKDERYKVCALLVAELLKK